MKKARSFLLIAVAIAALCGCTAYKSTGDLTLATGGTSGTYYPLGGAMARIWNAKIPDINVTAQTTGASVENLRLLNKGDAALGIVQNDILDYAYNGVAAFQGGKLTNISTIATLYHEVVQIAVTADSGIKSIEDLKGKRVSVGDAGAGGDFNAQQILEIYGLSFNDIEKQNLSIRDAGYALQNGSLDACFITAGVPNAALQSLALSKDLIMLTIDREHMDKLMDKYGYYTQTVIPKGTYKNVSEDINAVSIKATLVAYKKMSEDVVYELTKTLFESIDELKTAHAKGEELSLVEATKGVSVDFHPGALRYYREQGLEF